MIFKSFAELPFLSPQNQLYNWHPRLECDYHNTKYQTLYVTLTCDFLSCFTVLAAFWHGNLMHTPIQYNNLIQQTATYLFPFAPLQGGHLQFLTFGHLMASL